MIAFTTPRAIKVSTEDGRDVTLLEAIEFRTDDGAHYRVPVGATSDGASTPDEIWMKLPPFGPWWRAAVVHDSAYRGTLLRELTDGSWAPAMLPKAVCDDFLLWSMMVDGVDPLDRDIIFEGVRLAGQPAFDKNRSQPGN
jgi:hypothetical protein